MRGKWNSRRRYFEIASRYAALKKEFAYDSEKCAELERQMQSELLKLQLDWEHRESGRLIWEGDHLDVDLSLLRDKEYCENWDDPKRPLLNSKGRQALRRAIDEERIRRREEFAWWWKTMLIPVLAAATGVIGALTGLIAVLHHK